MNAGPFSIRQVRGQRNGASESLDGSGWAVFIGDQLVSDRDEVPVELSGWCKALNALPTDSNLDVGFGISERAAIHGNQLKIGEGQWASPDDRGHWLCCAGLRSGSLPTALAVEIADALVPDLSGLLHEFYGTKPAPKPEPKTEKPKRPTKAQRRAMARAGLVDGMAVAGFTRGTADLVADRLDKYLESRGL